MDRYSMFIDRTQYCQGVSSSQLHLYIQCDPSQNPSKVPCGYQQSDSKVYKEAKDPEQPTQC